MKRFTEKNEGFMCVVCGAENFPHPTSCRDHCTQCLSSLHVDMFPGDRANDCQGVMRPIGVFFKDGVSKIRFRCDRCNQLHSNKSAPDDNQELIIQLTAFPLSE